MADLRATINAEGLPSIRAARMLNGFCDAPVNQFLVVDAYAVDCEQLARIYVESRMDSLWEIADGLNNPDALDVFRVLFPPTPKRLA